MNIVAIRGDILTGGQSQKVALSTTSASTAAVTQPAYVQNGAPIRCLLALDAAGFIRKGTGSVTALADGTDMYLPANISVLVELMPGEKIAAILATGTGNLYLTPGV